MRNALLLHLLPGVCVAAAYLILAAVAQRAGLPRVTGLLAAFVFVGIPIQLAILRGGNVRYNVPSPWWQYVGGVIALVAGVMVLLQLPIGRVSDWLASHAFAWLPVAFSPAADADIVTFGRRVVLPILILQLLIDGIVNPLVEERYFRGFLLPRLEHMRGAAPIVNTALFALNHFWQPYNYVSIFIYVLPLTYFTWWRKNYYAQAFVHCLANSFGATMTLMAAMHS
jgi:membrane protease YdiL (CAAX protease family)